MGVRRKRRVMSKRDDGDGEIAIVRLIRKF